MEQKVLMFNVTQNENAQKQLVWEMAKVMAYNYPERKLMIEKFTNSKGFWVWLQFDADHLCNL